jgi:hypothetical protein
LLWWNLEPLKAKCRAFHNINEQLLTGEYDINQIIECFNETGKIMLYHFLIFIKQSTIFLHQRSESPCGLIINVKFAKNEKKDVVLFRVEMLINCTC